MNSTECSPLRYTYCDRNSAHRRAYTLNEYRVCMCTLAHYFLTIRSGINPSLAHV
ncbi:hypothetical protein phiK7A1_175 [Pseudomonas phage phiK7A1]|uniref:Uncharacterized protein n=1 Tax=Pseudomonas phage phiK7A1 TaxID=2759194 RepID=A0A7H0XG23_9CAUD|nr:hypothetical protein phiK7A1_175 [Pseudomonas phage phiK7A1]